MLFRSRADRDSAVAHGQRGGAGPAQGHVPGSDSKDAVPRNRPGSAAGHRGSRPGVKKSKCKKPWASWAVGPSADRGRWAEFRPTWARIRGQRRFATTRTRGQRRFATETHAVPRPIALRTCGCRGGTRPGGYVTPSHSVSIGPITCWSPARRQKVTGPGWPYGSVTFPGLPGDT